MNDSADKKASHESLTKAYGLMLGYTKEALDVAKNDIAPAVEEALKIAKQKVIELGEATVEEAEKVSEYLAKDVGDAAQYIHDHNKDFADWLNMDIKLIEAQLREQFSLLTDHTKAELEHIARVASRYGEWHTGEVTGLGALECDKCGQQLHFDKVSHVPPCPKCHGTKYKRPGVKL